MKSSTTSSAGYTRGRDDWATAMTALVLGLALVPLIDQLVKRLVTRSLGTRGVRLGAIGEVRAVRARLWLMRGPLPFPLRVIWIYWLLIAVGLTIATTRLPSIGWAAGLMLGGALSHTIETTRHGHIVDYICLRVWPAFNLADVALTVGAGGLIGRFLLLIITHRTQG